MPASWGLASILSCRPPSWHRHLGLHFCSFDNLIERFELFRI